jgi:endonuclease VIII
MPEGDTIFRAAQTLNRALAGKLVTRFESVFPALTRVADDDPIVGRTIRSVRSQGKHLLMAFSGGLTLRTHMRMNGSWHIYRPGEKWQRPARDMRVLVGTDDFVAVGFNVPVAEFLTDRDLARHPQLRALGPDLLDAAFGPDAARARVRAHGRDAIGDALLNQRAVAGIGNVFKSEILFVAGIDPFRRVDAMTDEELARVIDVAQNLLRGNVLSREQTLSTAIGRRTTRSLDPNEKLWVYARGGKPCRRCGTVIEARKGGVDARLTYWCPRCQR